MEFYLLLVGIAHYKGIVNAQMDYMRLLLTMFATEKTGGLAKMTPREPLFFRRLRDCQTGGFGINLTDYS